MAPKSHFTSLHFTLMAAAAMAAGGGGAEGDAIGQRFLVQEERLAVVVDHFAASRAPGARGAEDGDWRLALAEMREDARHALQVVRVHVEQVRALCASACAGFVACQVPSAQSLTRSLPRASAEPQL